MNNELKSTGDYKLAFHHALRLTGSVIFLRCAPPSGRGKGTSLVTTIFESAMMRGTAITIRVK